MVDLMQDPSKWIDIDLYYLPKIFRIFKYYLDVKRLTLKQT
jgi:hypothetical protein